MHSETAQSAQLVIPFPLAKSKAGKEPLTQLGNAERLVNAHGDNIRYCPQWGQWLIWTGGLWATDHDGGISRLAQITIRDMESWAKTETNEAVKAAIRDFARRSETRDQLRSMVSIAQWQPGISIAPAELDKNPYLFNCRNGTLDLKTGKLLNPDRTHMITKLAPVKYDAAATCPNWMMFLRRIFGGDDALIRYVQRVLGYALLLGDGNNGKTTLLEVFRNVMGDYAGLVEIDALMDKSETAASQRAVAEMAGKRFVTSSEVEQGQHLNEAKIKWLTGMAMLAGRRMYGSEFTFPPYFKLFMDANYMPGVRGTDNAIWDFRLRFSLKILSVSAQRKETIAKTHAITLCVNVKRNRPPQTRAPPSMKHVLADTRRSSTRQLGSAIGVRRWGLYG